MIKRKSLGATLLILAAFAPLASAQDTPESWRTASNGNWTAPARWSPEVVPNDGTPAGSLYAATIGLAGSYTVALNSNITVDNLTLGSALTGALLNQTAGTLTVNEAATVLAGTYTIGGTLDAGAVNLDGGAITLDTGDTINAQNVNLNSGTLSLDSGSTVENAAIALNNGALAVNNEDFNGVTLGGTGALDVNGSFNVQNGISGNDNILDMNLNATTYFDGSSGNQTVNGLDIMPTQSAVTIYASGPGSPTGQTLTLGASTTVHGGAVFINYGSNSDSLVNNGTINADSSNYTSYIDPSNFTNNGITEASNSGTLEIYPKTFSNGGNSTIKATGGGTVNLDSSVDNWTNNGTFDSSDTGVLNIYDLNWNNAGTVESTNGGALTVNLTNFTNTNTGLMQATGGSTLTINSADSPPWVNNGTLLVSDTSTLSLIGSTWTNAGTVEAVDGATLDLSTTNFTSTGAATIKATGGSTIILPAGNNGDIQCQGSQLLLTGNYTTASFATSLAAITQINSQSMLSIGGTITMNPGDTITPSGGETWQLGQVLVNNQGDHAYYPGTINGGTINQTNQSFYMYDGTLNGVTVENGDLHVNSGGVVSLENGTTISNSNVDLGANSTLYFQSTASQSISVNNLNITPSAVASVSCIGANEMDPATLTLGNNVTVHGGTNIVQLLSSLTLINNGTILGDNPNDATSIAVENFTNNATVEATNGGSVDIYGSPWINNGTFDVYGASTLVLGGNFTTADIGSLSVSPAGTLAINGTLNNAGAILTPSGGTWELTGTISGGTINVSGTPIHVYNGTLDDVTLAGGAVTLAGTVTSPGGVDVGDGATLDVTGFGTILNGNLTLTSDPSTLSFDLSHGEFNYLSVNGTLSLGGNLDVTLNDFTPLNSDVYILADATSMSGDFENVANGATLETTDGSGYFTVDYGTGQYADEIVLTDFTPGAVPEPASFSILALGSLTLLRRKRQC